MSRSILGMSASMASSIGLADRIQQAGQAFTAQATADGELGQGGGASATSSNKVQSGTPDEKLKEATPRASWYGDEL